MKRIGFVGSSDGSLVKYDPNVHAPKAPARPLTRHQRATLYFKAVRYIRELFKEVGFNSITHNDSSTSFTMELGSFILDMTVREADSMRIAHVTSYPGYVYDTEQIKAKVTPFSAGEPGEYVIQVGAVTPDSRSHRPIFVVIEKDSPDPLRDAFMNALTAARDMIRHDPATLAKIQEAMARRDIQKDFENIRDRDNNKLPGPG